MGCRHLELLDRPGFWALRPPLTPAWNSRFWISSSGGPALTVRVRMIAPEISRTVDEPEDAALAQAP